MARLIAFLIDSTLLVFSFSFVLYGLSDSDLQLQSWETLFQNGDFLGQLLDTVKLVFINPYFLVMHWLYFTVLQSSQKQASVGKFSLGLRVTDLRGRRISFARANLRYFAKLLSVATVFLGFLLMLSTRRKQTLHDYLSCTVVVTD
ncbi:RDD family protein [Pontibacter sp. E15-1]|uniref:RDD family protein n=1 Tax=Pontibacter sp. E15-1 TaxID=2919918 RepID=UPI001F4FE9E2|nr:RDD family protein [Pontibacter sp. E15-1]MCJ8164878.1 RDD family protein [Pontibacter sp. E15-1]